MKTVTQVLAELEDFLVSIEHELIDTQIDEVKINLRGFTVKIKKRKL